MTIKKYAGDKITGIQFDSKPTNVPDGATFYETDTKKVYLRTGSAWVEVENTKANDAYNLANTINAIAIAAYANANSKFANTTGTFPGDLTLAGRVYINNATGLGGSDEGGEIQLANATSNSALSGTISIDIFQNKLRFFETNSPNRGAFINLASATAGVGSDLLAAAGGSTDIVARTAAGAAYDKANSANVLAFNALPNTSGVTFNGTLNISQNVSADKVLSSNNGFGENFRVGDDVWLGDTNIADTIRLKGQQNSSNGYIMFGPNDGIALGRYGTNALTYGGNTVWHAGNSANASDAFDRANAANVLAFNTGIGANAYANSVGAGANAYMIAVQNGANTAVGTGANTYLLATIAGANNAVGNGANAFAAATIAGANAAVGLAANNYSNATFLKLTATDQTLTGNLNIVGNFTLSGNTVFIDATRLQIDDPLLYLAGNNYTSDIVDIGFIANYMNATGANVHTGLYREHENKMYYLFNGYDKEPINNHIGALSNNMTLAVLNADMITSNLTLGGVNAIVTITSAYNQANAANLLAFNTGVGANTFAAATIAGANTAVGGGANAFATAATAGANAYMIAVQAGANTAVGAGANAFTSATIAGANTAVGTGANTYLLATIAGANTAVGTGANTYLLATIAGANTAVGGGANAYMIAVQNGANTAVGTAANNFAVATFNAANNTPIGNTVGVAYTLRSTRRAINFIPGSNITINVDDDSAGDRSNITITSTATGGGGGGGNNTTIVADAVNATRFLLFANVSSGTLYTANASTGITFNPSSNTLTISGALNAQTKSFVINHPTKEGMFLRYGSLEGPENGVYVRGKLNDERLINLPDYWKGLVDENTITVNLTPSEYAQNNIYVYGVNIDYITLSQSFTGFFTVFAERKDVDKLIVEY